MMAAAAAGEAGLRLAGASSEAGPIPTLVATLSLAGETWSAPAVAMTVGGAVLVASDRTGCIQAWRGADLTPLWRRELKSEITSSPVVVDLAGDGRFEVLIGTHGGDLYRLAIDTGATVSRFRLGEAIRSIPAVADVDGDGELEIIVGSYGPSVWAIKRNGSVLWQRKLPKHLFIGGTKRGTVSPPLVHDVDRDGKLEIVLGTRSARLFCLDAASGEPKWFTTVKYDPDSSPAFAMAGEKPLVVFGGGEHTSGPGDNAIIALDGRTGERVWAAPAGGGVDSSPMIISLPGGKVIAVACSLATGRCLAVNLADGSPAWSYDFPHAETCSHADGHCRPADGRPYFTENAICRSYTTPLVVKPAGAAPMVVVGNNAGHIVALDAETGAVRFADRAEGMVRGSLILAPLSPDGGQTLVVPAGSTLRLYSWAVDAPPTLQFKGRLDHLGADHEAPVATGPALPPAEGLKGRMFWRLGVLDAWRHLLIKLDDKVLRRLGVKLLEHGY
jgi:outer membrane protein assembly factor BamB